MEIKLINIDEIKPYEKNPRKNEKAVQYVERSIKEFGFKVPVIIDKDNVLDEKQSPSDDEGKWNYLVSNHIYKLNRQVKGGI